MSPYVSNAQRKFFHTKAAKRAGITAKEIKEFDQASKGLNLPAKVNTAYHKHSKRYKI